MENDYEVSYYVYMYGKHKPIVWLQDFEGESELGIARRVCELTRLDNRLLQGYRITHVIMVSIGNFCETLESNYIWNVDTTDEHKAQFEEHIAERISHVIAKVKQQHAMHCLTVAS
jgi:hypothetical protein